MIALRMLVPSLIACLALAADARAGDLSLSFGKHGKHGSFGISIASHGVGPGVVRPVAVCPPYQAARPVWMPGRYEVVHEKVWVAGRREKVWIAPHPRQVCDAYGRTRTVFEPGRWEIVETPGHYETRAVQVWRPGHYAAHGVVAYRHDDRGRGRHGY